MRSTRNFGVSLLFCIGLLATGITHLILPTLVNSAWVSVNRNLAGSMTDEGALQSAADRLELARGLTGGSISVATDLGYVYHHQRKIRLASLAWREAGTDPRTLLMYALRSLEKEDYDAALGWLQYAKTIEPEMGELYYWSGRIHNSRQETLRAISELRHASNLAPNNRDVLYELAMSYRDNQEPDAALRALNNSYEALDSYGQVGRSNVLFEMGDIQFDNHDRSNDSSALDIFQRAIRIDEFTIHPWQKADAHYKRGLILVSLSELQNAKTEFEKALELNPTAYAVRLSYARVLQQLGETEKAIGVLRRAIELRPDRPDAMILAGDINYWSGNLDDAREYYLTAAALAPENRSLEARLSSLGEGAEQKRVP